MIGASARRPSRILDRGPATLSEGRRRALRHGLSAAGLMFAGYLLLVVAPGIGTFGFDAFAYWVVDAEAPYRPDLPIGHLGFFAYSPALAQLADPLGMVPWWVFLTLFSSLLVGTLVWLGGRWSLAWLCFPPVLVELYHGNIHLLLGTAIVLGFRRPWAWAFVLLSKVTPGIGLVWFAVRREWRSLAVALVVTAVIVAVSWFSTPAVWAQWIETIRQGAPLDCGAHCIDVPLTIRIPAALAIVVLGALHDQRWTVPVASMLALPVLWISGLSMIVAAAALAARDAAREAEPGPGGSRARSVRDTP